MVYPKKNIAIKTCLQLYVRWITARYFNRINFNEISTDKSKSILLIANHFSAWETIALYHINRIFLKRNFHAMMLEKTVLKEPALKYAGAFSVNPGSRDVIQSVDFAAKLLDEPNNLVLIFPQGKLYSNMVTDVQFESGVAHIIKKAKNFQLLFAAIFIENFDNLKPEANVYFKIQEGTNFNNVDALQQAYQQHYTQSRQQQIQITK
jgi:1-acyl-sn-glycerol-3-phosphate acyltransferase